MRSRKKKTKRDARITFTTVKNRKKGRPLYRFLPVGLNYNHAVERGGNVLFVKRLTRKRQAGDDSFFC